MKKNLFITSCFLLLACPSFAQSFDLYPLCTTVGDITCPDGYLASCEDEINEKSEPRCLFYGSMHVPGCWKYIGKKSIDFSFLPNNLPSSAMIKITGGGDVFTLNREIVGCKKL